MASGAVPGSVVEQADHGAGGQLDGVERQGDGIEGIAPPVVRDAGLVHASREGGVRCRNCVRPVSSHDPAEGVVMISPVVYGRWWWKCKVI